MADVFSPSKRSEVMSRIRSTGNMNTEMRLIGIMKRNGIKGWRRHQPLPGSPDFMFRRERVALFVDGCFWHGCPRCYRSPKSHRAFWKQKVCVNRKRDRRVVRELRLLGWRVVRFWECSLCQEARVVARIKRILYARNVA